MSYMTNATPLACTKETDKQCVMKDFYYYQFHGFE